MLGETKQLAGNLWYIEGLMPDDFTQDVDRANALVYRAGDRLYVLDTGSGEAMRPSLEKLINVEKDQTATVGRTVGSVIGSLHGCQGCP